MFPWSRGRKEFTVIIDFYWVLFLLSLFVFAAIGFGLAEFFSAKRTIERSRVAHGDRRY